MKAVFSYSIFEKISVDFVFYTLLSMTIIFNLLTAGLRTLNVFPEENTMSERLDYFSISPKAINILLEQEQYLASQCDSGQSISKTVLELVKLRVSQINQCAYCIDMHSKDAVQIGESPQRLYALSAWRYAPFYSEIERCALEWAECLTAGQGVDDQHYQRALSVLGEQTLVDLTIAVNAINSWNRIAKAFAPEVGGYSPS